MSNYETHQATEETATERQILQNQLNIHTAIPCKVESFNAKNQTVTLAVQIKQVLTDGDSVQLPPLVDVPVSYPRGGGFAVTFPLQKGDEGFVVFSERCIDGWWQSGNASEPLDMRYHDLSDAMFVPGICSIPNVIGGFFTGGLSLQTLDGSTYIRVKNGTIEMKGNINHFGDTNQEGNTISTGTITGKTNVMGGGISLNSHTHKNVQGGKDTSGGPQ